MFWKCYALLILAGTHWRLVFPFMACFFGVASAISSLTLGRHVGGSWMIGTRKERGFKYIFILKDQL